MKKDIDSGVTVFNPDEMEKLLHQIEMPQAFAFQVMNCARKQDGSFPFASDQGAAEMARQLKIAIANRRNGLLRDIPEPIWIDTMKCFSRFVLEHMQSCGVYGFDRGFWTTRQISGKLFRIGELEYELLEENNENIIALHIPSDALLEGKRLNESVAQARAFFKARFPAWENRPIKCESWLLSPELKRLLHENSRILRFQQGFDISEASDDALEAVLQWVFRLTPSMQKNAALKALPESTSLQRAMKAYLLSGGTIHSGFGPLVRPFPG